MKECRYFAYKLVRTGKYRGQKLLPSNIVSNMEASLVDATFQGQRVELHATLTTYSQYGDTLYSPLYADFDGLGCENDVIHMVKNIRKEFGITPNIYYSGNRGFHIIIPIKITHSHPHLVSKLFFETITKSQYLDKQMYVSRHLLRCDGSYHGKSGLHKTGITFDELCSGLDNIKRIAKTSQPKRIPCEIGPNLKLNLFLDTIYYRVDEHLRAQREKNEYQTTENETNPFIPHCIKTIISQEPLNGEWNETITTLARWFNAKGFQKEDAFHMMLKHDHWQEDQGHVSRVFNSVFMRESFFGCDNNEILQANCCELCPFNDTEIDL